MSPSLGLGLPRSSGSTRTTRRSLSRLLQIADAAPLPRRQQIVFGKPKREALFRRRVGGLASVLHSVSQVPPSFAASNPPSARTGDESTATGPTLSHGSKHRNPPPSSQADKPFPLSSPLSPSASSPTLLLPSHGRGMRCSRGLLARCFASARTAAVQSNSLSSSSIVAASALKSWPGGAAMSTSSSRRSMVMVSASPLSSSSSLHRSRGLSAKATATAAEGGDGGGDADAGGALTVMGRIIDTELKDEAEKSYIAVRRREERGGQRRRNSPPSFFFFPLPFRPPLLSPPLNPDLFEKPQTLLPMNKTNNSTPCPSSSAAPSPTSATA